MQQSSINVFFFKLSLNSPYTQKNNKPGVVTDGNNYDNVNNIDGSGKFWNDQNRNGNIGPGAQQGMDKIPMEDDETYKNRMYSYIIMASSVVVLAVLMVSRLNTRLYV